MSTLSLQLYTLRDELEKDADATLAAVADMGLTVVEPFGIENFDWLPEALAKHGLTAESAHAGLLGETQDKVIEAAGKLGTKVVFQPFWDVEQWKSRDGIDALAAKLNEAAAKVGGQFQVGYHNHWFEFDDLDGVNAYDYFVDQLDDAVVLELDTFWAQAGGMDVPALLNKYGSRIGHIHVKDGYPDPVTTYDAIKANEVLGTGRMDLPSILDISGDRTWVVEFDTCEGDVVQAVRDSVAYLQNR